MFLYLLRLLYLSGFLVTTKTSEPKSDNAFDISEPRCPAPVTTETLSVKSNKLL